MDRKKFLVMGLLSLFMISMIAGLVMAAETSPEDAGRMLGEEAKGIGEGVFAFFNAVFGNVAIGEGETLSTIFFALLLAMFIYTALNSFFGVENKFIVWGVTAAVTVLAIIAMPAEYLTAIRTSYGVMGLTILAVVPFIIIFAFTLKTQSKALARGTWLVFAFYYFWMYMATLFDPGEGVSRIPYVLAILVGIAMFFFIGWARLFIFKEDLSGHIESAKRKLRKRKEARDLSDEGISQDSGINVDGEGI